MLAAGGGGNVEVGEVILRRSIEQFGEVKLVSLNEIDDDDLIIPMGMMGAPIAGIEKFGYEGEPSQVVRLLAEKLGRDVSAVTAVEVGGSNSMIPMVAAVQLGVPMVDADSMGRAFPETQMTSFHLKGVPASPLALIDERGNKCMVEATDTFWAEKISRTITSIMGARSMVATFAMDGRTAKSACIDGTITLSEKIGDLLMKSRGKEEVLADLLELVRGVVLFRGKVTDLHRETVGGFNKGSVSLNGFDEYSSLEGKIFFQNENLVFYADSRPVATVPDIITVLNSETWVPITTEELKYGLRTIVVGLPCAPIWRTAEGLEVAGPRYFGYDVDYSPVEERARRPR